MKYADFCSRSSFSSLELLAFAHGTLLEDAPAGFGTRLPTPPMLMIDRILELERRGPRGKIVAERDVRLDDWFFQCHFVGDPVQPGCLGLDGVWQLIGFYCAWRGGRGAGRALGCGEVEFSGQIRPHDRIVRYEVEIARFAQLQASGASVAVADARVLVDGDLIYQIKRAKVGTFLALDYPDYPNPSSRSRGGRLER